ncbi:MAG: RNA helicase, partial [Gammaproteobacteria bacterium]|nr:RNA helicase [Gammaproteobacteria bacterium]
MDNSCKIAVSDYPPVIATRMDIQEILQKCKKTDINYISKLNTAIQRITSIKPVKKRRNVKDIVSKWSIIKKIEQEIVNLDLHQKQAAIETPDGPQRIRGLAGSGKTVVLALKAACLHSQNPDWDIAVTFQTHSLYQQFRDLIRRSAFEHSSDEPNWDKLKVLHAWGSINTSGLYSVIADSIGYPVRDFLYGKSKYGYEQAF